MRRGRGRRARALLYARVTVDIEYIGWASAAILLVTLARQVYTQWQQGSSEGVSRWLFAGQVLASLGFITYSALVANWVFVATNTLVLLTAIVGAVVTAANRRATRDPP